MQYSVFNYFNFDITFTTPFNPLCTSFNNNMHIHKYIVIIFISYSEFERDFKLDVRSLCYIVTYYYDILSRITYK